MSLSAGDVPGAIHIACVPCFRAVVEHVAGMPWPAVRAVVHAVDVADSGPEGGRLKQVVERSFVQQLHEGGMLEIPCRIGGNVRWFPRGRAHGDAYAPSFFFSALLPFLVCLQPWYQPKI